MKKIIVTATTIIVVSMLLLKSGILPDGTEDTPEWRMWNFRIWKETPAWELAQAVKRQDCASIKRIAKANPNLLDYQEPRFGESLLIWTVGVSKYAAAETLLQCGANPNLATKDGRTALFVAAGQPWVEIIPSKSSKYIKLLVKYKADPNICFVGGGQDTMTFPGSGPLLESINNGIEKTRALVDAGADINHKAKFGYTAAIQALWMNGNESTTDRLRYVHYLIAEKHATIMDPYYNFIVMSADNPNQKFFPVDLLRDIHPINADETKMKNEIIEEFERQGVKY